MPRAPRVAPGGFCYHVINRANARALVFHDDVDYARFESFIRRACERIPMRIVAYCLMPNHFHFVLWPYGDTDLSRWMHWLMTAHVVAHRARYSTVGRIWQGRFKSFMAQTDHHLIAVVRYVERNPVRAHLVRRAVEWRWSSLCAGSRGADAPRVSPGPVERSLDWTAMVNMPQTSSELERIRLSVNRERPYGESGWVKVTAERFGLEITLRPPGRPRRRPDRD